ncbi:SDR family oxidoreductase [Parahaliea maris]|uniref:SDR family oxidoreductase n=1 Tax=Parahaliea maris TaxID=2716870 RepID=A0A5C9A8T5_9GAMM|nr:SDR family oxidoreductase [Parahaliea maris]TXS96454.1 SDR family oxidoreductase [Parahaliea maris]
MQQEFFNLSDETILVTGGGTGLGKQLAKTLASAGATVFVCARRHDKLEDTVEQIRESGGVAHALPLDVTDSSSVIECLRNANAISPVTGLVNNAGVGTDLLLKDMPENMWDMALNTNLKGAWLLARELVNDLIRRERVGFVINISSALATSVQMGTGAYAAAKAGLNHLTQAMAYEWARYGVRVNAVAPGYFRTELATEFLESDYGKKLEKRIPQRRLGNPADLDGVILLLASKASSYMTGSVITVDGGLTMSTI